MKGTERQIARAEYIKNAAMSNVLHNIELYMQRYEEYDHYDHRQNYLVMAESFRIMAACLEKIFSAHDDAKFFINHREVLRIEYLCQMVDIWAGLIQKGKKTAAQIAFEYGITIY